MCKRTQLGHPVDVAVMVSVCYMHPGHKGFRRAGVSAAIYTGFTDIEVECDGFLTYDRRLLKYNQTDVTGATGSLTAGKAA